jgi:hypothetical protein
MKEIAEGLARRPEGESQSSLVDRLREFVEMEARSGSMDPGCITPLYIYRMWGGSVSMEEIEAGLQELRRGNFF